nr:TRAP transporter large permease subunit [uncultured Roseateles sp.]
MSAHATALLGLAMFALALLLIIVTGLPSYAVLLGVSGGFGGLGMALGVIDVRLLGALPARIVGLLEHDLLQALALYALVGALLHRLVLAPTLLRVASAIAGGSARGAALGGLLLGALTAPLNGAVGASLNMQLRTVMPALRRAGIAPARATALVAVASTLGVVVPPSLVLVLLGDAMMRAHTEALNVTHQALRIVNLQDVMQAALLPGALVLLAVLGVAALTAGRSLVHRPEPAPPLTRGQIVTALLSAAAILGLLSLVATGKLYAVEAAATGGLLLLAHGLLSHQLDRALLRQALSDAMALTGMVFALLVAASSFTLVLRALGTDLLLTQALHQLDGWGTPVHATLVLGLLMLCAFVLDAFELIFLVVPLIMPPLLMVAGDAAQIAALTLLVLQLGFLLPPLGYAVLMAGAGQPEPPGRAALARELAPYLLAIAGVIALTASVPALTHALRSNADTVPAAQLSDDEVLRQLDDAARAAEPVDAAPSAARP